VWKGKQTELATRIHEDNLEYFALELDGWLYSVRTKKNVERESDQRIKWSRLLRMRGSLN
jgi:hypothetical protein